MTKKRKRPESDDEVEKKRERLVKLNNLSVSEQIRLKEENADKFFDHLARKYGNKEEKKPIVQAPKPAASPHVNVIIPRKKITAPPPIQVPKQNEFTPEVLEIAKKAMHCISQGKTPVLICPKNKAKKVKSPLIKELKEALKSKGVKLSKDGKPFNKKQLLNKYNNLEW